MQYLIFQFILETKIVSLFTDNTQNNVLKEQWVLTYQPLQMLVKKQ